jgi:copper chaperone NosL
VTIYVSYVIVNTKGIDMKKFDIVITLFASLILLGSFFFPIWEIELQAPQYPEGIGLQIWVNQIIGVNEHDLHNINKLNHYIGMKEIVPEAIPELTYMPYIIMFLSLFGISASILKKKYLVTIWLGLIIIFMMAGLYDFYLWGYDYGHNLNPNAPIKVPGMSYQPPLIGSKQLLNMTSVSLPAMGSFFIAISFMMGLFVLLRSKLEKGLRK